jgi:hypothetical protein
MNYIELEQHIKNCIRNHQIAIENGTEECDYEHFTQAMVDGGYDKSELPMSLIYETPSYDGETKQWVFEHKNGDESIFVMFTGYYSSYEGHEVNEGFHQVFPYTFTETRYK